MPMLSGVRLGTGNRFYGEDGASAMRIYRGAKVSLMGE